MTVSVVVVTPTMDAMRVVYVMLRDRFRYLVAVNELRWEGYVVRLISSVMEVDRIITGLLLRGLAGISGDIRCISSNMGYRSRLL